MVADEVEWLGAKVHELLAEYQRLEPKHTFVTFAEVEHAWQEVVAPRLSSFQSMQEKWGDQQPLPKESPWGRNSAVPEGGVY
jgi:hypothetical protein